jgi:uncharacterized protein (TIGR00369 family)
MPHDASDAARTRTVNWSDPMIGARSAGGMTGLEYLRAIASGAVPPPPIALLLGFTLVEIEPGRAVFELHPGEHQYNPIGMVHGGVASTVLDSVMACAIHSLLPAGVAYTTLELHVNFVRAITVATGTLRAEGEAVHSGSRVSTAQGRLVDAAGKLYAHATTTCLVISSAETDARR